MNYNFTEGVRHALSMARAEANRLGHDYVGTEHLLLGLLGEPRDRALTVLANLNGDTALVRDRIEESIRRGRPGITPGELPYTSRAKKSLEYAMAESRDMNSNDLGTEYLLLGLLREEKGIAAVVLNSVGINLEDVRAEVLRLRMELDA